CDPTWPRKTTTRVVKPEHPIQALMWIARSKPTLADIRDLVRVSCRSIPWIKPPRFFLCATNNFHSEFERAIDWNIHHRKGTCRIASSSEAIAACSRYTRSHTICDDQNIIRNAREKRTRKQAFRILHLTCARPVERFEPRHH